MKRPVSVAFGNDNKIFVADKDKSEIDIFGIIYQTQPNEIKKTTTTKATKTSNGNENDNNNGKSRNDPCNYYGLDVCNKSHTGCDDERFDCLTEDCHGKGKDGTTGTCNGDDDKICWKNGEYLNKCYSVNDGQNSHHDDKGNNGSENYKVIASVRIPIGTLPAGIKPSLH